MLKAAALTAAAGLPAYAFAANEAPAAASSSDPWRGLKVGVATYSFRKLPLDACMKGIQRVDLHYCSIKDFHLPMTSTSEQRKAVAKQFRDAGIVPLSCGNITLKNDEAKSRVAFEYVRDVGAPTSRTYSNATRLLASSFLSVMFPQLRGTIPASRNCFATALRCSDVLVIGR